MLNEAAIAELEKSLKLALDIELPRLQEIRDSCKANLTRLEIPVVTRPLHPIATVATDGGENQLRLDPIRVHVLRVADSDGTRHFDGFIPMSHSPEEILERYFTEAPLMRLLESELGFEIRTFLPENSYQRGNFLQMLREVLEWAALLKLAAEKVAPRLIMRDGLLRSIIVPERIWQPLRNRLQHYTTKNQHLFVGVAKSSAVLNYLSLAVSLEAALPQGVAGYAPIPAALEKSAAPPSYSWLGPRSLGALFALRPTEAAAVAFACEVPSWMQDDAPMIMAQLAANVGGFPNAAYPLALVEAHNYARIGEFEIAFLERLLLKGLAERDARLSLEVSLQQLLGRRLSLPVEVDRD